MKNVLDQTKDRTVRDKGCLCARYSSSHTHTHTNTYTHTHTHTDTDTDADTDTDTDRQTDTSDVNSLVSTPLDEASSPPHATAAPLPCLYHSRVPDLEFRV